MVDKIVFSLAFMFLSSSDYTYYERFSKKLKKRGASDFSAHEGNRNNQSGKSIFINKCPVCYEQNDIGFTKISFLLSNLQVLT